MPAQVPCILGDAPPEHNLACQLVLTEAKPATFLHVCNRLAGDSAQSTGMSPPEGAGVTSSKQSSRKIAPDGEHKGLIC